MNLMPLQIPTLPWEMGEQDVEGATAARLAAWRAQGFHRKTHTIPPCLNGQVLWGDMWVSVTTGDVPVAFRVWVSKGANDYLVFGGATQLVKLPAKSRWSQQLSKDHANVTFERLPYDENDLCMYDIAGVLETRERAA